MKKRVKRRINKKGLLFLILVTYFIGSFIYSIFTMPLNNVVVLGNHYVSDKEIIDTAKLNNYPNIFKISIYKTKKLLLKNELMNTVEVRKNILGKITITVTENKPLFVNALTGKIILANNKIIDYSNSYLGIPTLINYVPSDIYEELIDGMNKIDNDIINAISEIEYSPDKSGEIVFDEARFLLRMNDGNLVYINTPNIKKLNNYNEIYSEVGSKGILLLDSNSSNYIFKKN